MGPLYRIRIEAESTAFKAQDPHVKRLARTVRDHCRYCEEIEKVAQEALQQVTYARRMGMEAVSKPRTKEI